MKSHYNIHYDTFCKEPVAAKASLEMVWIFFPPSFYSLSDHLWREKVSMECEQKVLE